MRNIVAAVASFLVLIIAVPAAWADYCQVSFTPKTPMPDTLRYSSAAFFSDRVYVVSGCEPDGLTFSDEVYVYDVKADTWGLTTPIPTARSEACNTGMIDFLGKFCVIGGHVGNSVYSQAAECFDPVEETWSALNTLPEALTGVYCGVHDDIIYVTGGIGESGYNSNLYYYNLHTKGSWVQATVPRPIASAWGFGGITRHGLWDDEKDWQFTQVVGESTNVTNYDIATGTWSDGSASGANRTHMCGVNFDSTQLYLVGGADNESGDPKDNIVVYDSIEDDWYVAYEYLPAPRAGHSCALTASDNIVLVGGYDDVKSDLNSVLLFNPCAPRIDESSDDCAEPGDTLIVQGANFAVDAKATLLAEGSTDELDLDEDVIDESRIEVSIPDNLLLGDYKLVVQNSSAKINRRFDLEISNDCPDADDDDDDDDDSGGGGDDDDDDGGCCG